MTKSPVPLYRDIVAYGKITLINSDLASIRYNTQTQVV